MSACPFCAEALPSEHQFVGEMEPCACPKCLNAFLIKKEAGALVCVPFADLPDVRAVATPGSIGGEILAALRKTIDALPVLPEVSSRVMSLVRDPNCSMNDLAALISQDQVIAARILRVANSAMYGGLQEIRDLKNACSRLGMRTVANLVQAVASDNLYDIEDPVFRDKMRVLWRHAIATAHAANEVALMIAEPRPDALFVAGLIHDIGQVVLLDLIARGKSAVLATVRESKELLTEVIVRYHALVGFHAVCQWKLPPEFAVITLCHHDIARVPRESWLAMGHIVCLADGLAKACGHGSAVEEAESLMASPSTEFLGLSDVKVAALQVDLEDKINTLIDTLATI